MTRHILPGDPPITITLRKSARARRYSLRVSRLDGRVTLSVPALGTDQEAIDFARQKEPWLRRVLQQAGEGRPVVIGGSLPFEGRQLIVAEGAMRAPVVMDDKILLPSGARPGPVLKAFLKASARERLWSASHDFASRLGREFSRITLRDTRSRWGSCTSDGRLMYSWRLVMAPLPVLRYVAAHEVAHLVHMDHSPRFWSVVAELMPDYAEHRAWLKQNGGALLLVDFGA
ncbi:hypothetical protein LV82_00085 [Albidovulum inexpectatum]|uniref:YgjP-like metallopeptidase domain-containing protein n=1 Tax=Albidovulum inexpectatum TaxID=196587 RepID=A0A2S5JL66_9RHOB|nr:SprT family zinc-dependent metalloprotease [Albidovulum inexpectatum]PPB82163.1 hypothetical protein LV82_00085 [Albidovulum inexpectatum]